MKKGDIVIAPKGCSGYLAEGREYEVIEVFDKLRDLVIFTIKDDEDTVIICLSRRCGHLGGGNWGLVNKN